MSTHDDLKEAFAGESQAFQKYTAFAEAAEKEGLRNIARLFRTTAQAERIHAAGHFAALEGIGPTTANLEAAIAGETYEYTQMYPPMLARAEAEGHRAGRMFKFAVGAERVHAELYGRALAAARQGKDLAEKVYYLCPVCGHIESGKPPAKCPICGVPAAKYITV